MSLEARGRGVHVFLGTLLPERPDGCRAYAIPPKGDTDLITPTNNSIRGMAAAENIDLIDLATLFTGQVDTLIGQDGLHPTEAGHAAMATAFFDAIRAKFERPNRHGEPDASAMMSERRLLICLAPHLARLPIGARHNHTRVIRARLFKPFILFSVLLLLLPIARLVDSGVAGFRAEHFRDAGFRRPPAFSTIDSETSAEAIRRAWSGAPPDALSADWTGWILIPRDGDYSNLRRGRTTIRGCWSTGRRSSTTAAAPGKSEPNAAPVPRHALAPRPVPADRWRRAG